MALIKCPECGKEISDRAKSCPNCGCPVNVYKKNTRNIELNRKKIIVIIAIIVFIIGILSFFIVKYKYNKDNPKIIGDIRLNMSQKDVENILHKKIGNNLDIDSDTDGDEICIFEDEIRKIDNNKTLEDLYSTGVVSLDFDKNNKLQQIDIGFFSTTIMKNDVLENFGLGLKESDIHSYRPDVFSVKFYYGITGNTYVEFNDRLDGVDKDYQSITFMRKVDARKGNKHVN